MSLVDYSDSDSDADGGEEATTKKRKLSASSSLPPLPARFRDLYSSTVRTSTHDDPALHGGRKRATPHVAGNWPTHVFLDWTPDPTEYKTLQQLLAHVQQSATTADSVHSLLENDLGVQQPLHVSLSRPLALKTEDKDRFFSELETVITASAVTAFDVQPLDLVWHSNEDRTRWFLVLRLQRTPTDELRVLLAKCNELAARYDQPLLYQSKPAVARLSQTDSPREEQQPESHDGFHISIAWSVQLEAAQKIQSGPISVHLPNATQKQITALNITFSEVKVRIGQDVHAIPLEPARKR